MVRSKKDGSVYIGGLTTNIPPTRQHYGINYNPATGETIYGTWGAQGNHDVPDKLCGFAMIVDANGNQKKSFWINGEHIQDIQDGDLNTV